MSTWVSFGELRIGTTWSSSDFYAAILQAIAHGYRTPSKIANAAGLNAQHISMYLSNLIKSGFVERRIPVTKTAATRLGRHHITDPFLRFYYRFLARRQAQFAMGIQDQALAEIKKHLVDFIGTYTWEELCREWVLRATGKAVLPFWPDRVGSIWNAKAQIDVAGVNFMEKTLVLGECRWGRGKCGVQVLTKLVENTSKVLPPGSGWKVDYHGFSRSGWTDAAEAYAQTVADHSPLGGEWQSVGMGLSALPEIDQDLMDWSQ